MLLSIALGRKIDRIAFVEETSECGTTILHLVSAFTEWACSLDEPSILFSSIVGRRKASKTARCIREGKIDDSSVHCIS